MRKGATYANGKWTVDPNTGGNPVVDNTERKVAVQPDTHFISKYDTTGSWKQHAQDNNLTDRDSVRRF